MPEEATNCPIIVGISVLEQAHVNISENSIIVQNKRKENFLMKSAVDNKINNEAKVDGQHIKDLDRRNIVSQLISEYRPAKNKTTNIQMKIVLKSEEPVYQRPQRFFGIRKSRSRKSNKRMAGQRNN